MRLADTHLGSAEIHESPGSECVVFIRMVLRGLSGSRSVDYA